MLLSGSQESCGLTLLDDLLEGLSLHSVSELQLLRHVSLPRTLQSPLRHDHLTNAHIRILALISQVTSACGETQTMHQQQCMYHLQQSVETNNAPR